MKKLLTALATAATAALGFAEITAREDFENSSYTAYDNDKPSLAAPYDFEGYGDYYMSLDDDDGEELLADGASCVDAVMQFKYADAPDEFDGTEKLVVFANSDGKLVVVDAVDTNVTTTAIAEDTWYRLTIVSVDETVNDATVKKFKVYVNGGLAVTEGGADSFKSRVADSNSVTKMTLSGTGKVDNFVARTTDPFGGAPAGWIANIGTDDPEQYFTDYTKALEKALAGATLTFADENVQMDGTAAHPFEIRTAADLKALQAAVADGNGADKCYVQTADIALTEAWPGIGVQNGKDLVDYTVGTASGDITQEEADRRDAKWSAGAFKGTYDGGNYTISNFQMVGVAGNPDSTTEGLDYCGFFNSVDGATIKNLKIAYAGSLFATDTTVSTKESGATFVGVAKNSTLQNLTSLEGTVSCSKGFGGIVGYLMAGSTVDSCTNNVNMTSLADNKCGGIAMITQGGSGTATIRNCQNNGTTASNANQKGGIVGYVCVATEIADCEATAGSDPSFLHHQSGTLTMTGVNKAPAGVKSYTKNSTNIDGLNFATVDNGVATFVADDALAAGNTYKVMGPTATATYAFTNPGSISFDTSLATPTYAITVANPNMFDVTSATEEDVTTYTAVGGTAVASLTKDEVATEYNTIAKALAAAGEGDTVELEADSDEDVSLPTGVSFATNGNTYSGTVTAAAGNGYVAVMDANGMYAVVENTASTWVGESGGLWATASNWSTGAVPDQYTTVTLPDGSAISVTGTSAIPVGNVIVGGAVSVTCTGNLANNYPSIGVYGAVSGEGTLTLNRVGLKSMDADEVVVGCNIYFDSKGHDCFVEAGSFVFNGSFTGTGRCDILTTTAFNGAVTIPDGATLRLGKSGFYPVISFGNDATLSGDGTVVIFSNGWDSRNASQLAGIKAKVTAAAWQGVCELSGSMTWIDFGNFGHSGSVVRANGLSGYLRYSSGSTTEVANGITALDIGADGLTLNNGFSSGKYGYTIAAKLTGSGPMHFGTRQNDTAVGQYFLTGDMSEFTGAIDFGTLENYRPAVIIKTASEDKPAVNDYGQIIVAAGRTGELAPKIATAWDAPGGFVIYGEAKVSNGGSITSVNGVAGSGKLVYEFMPTSAPAFCAGVTSPGTSRDVPAWSGAVELPVRNGSGALNLAQFGQTGSKIVLNGITGTDANSIYLANSSKEIAATVELKGLLKLTDGSTDDNYKFAEVTGSGSMFLSATGSAGTPHYTYTFEKLTDYTGEINAVKTSDSKYAALEIGTVAVSSFTLGQKMVDLAANCNLVTSPGAINVEVDGMGSDLNGHHLFKAADGDLYVIAAQVTVDETTTYFATLAEAAEFALENNAQIVKIDSATPTALPGWSYEHGVFTKLDIAQVGETTYKTLDLAIANAGTDDILLINDCAETVTLGKGQTIKPGIYSFSGVLKGEGTIYYAAKPDTVPAFEDWTGTFVADWPGAHGDSFPANDYGILGSVVEVRKLGGGYVPIPGTDNVDRTVLPTISIPEGCYMKLANGYANTKTVFTKVTGAGAMTNNSYTVEIATLENFTGTISSDLGTKVVDVVTSTAAAPGGCLVKGGLFTDVASITVNGSAPTYALEYKAAAEQPGIYYAVAATLNNGETVTNHGSVLGALNNAYINLPTSFGWIVTVLDATWEDKGEYDEYFTWDPVARTYTVITYPARIGTTYYPTLAAAIEAAHDGETVVLLDNIALTEMQAISKSVTLDLNGKNVTATDCRAFHVTAGTVAFTGTGTISTVVTQGTKLASSSSVIRVGSNTAETNFTLGENVTVTSDYCYGITYFGTQPQTVAINGTVAVTGAQAAISGNGTSTMAAVTLTVGGTVSATQDYAIYNPQTGTTAITGTVTGGIEVKAGTVTVAGTATVTARNVTPSHSSNQNGTSTQGYAIASVGNSSYKQPAKVGVAAGATVTGSVIILKENNSETYGEITSAANTLTIPEGYVWNGPADGVYTLAVASGFDGGDGSATFSIDSDVQAAIAAVLPSGKTLESEVLRDPADETSGTGMTYAQAYALGLLDLKTGAVKDLKSSISFDANGKVVVSLAESPLEAYTVTLKVYTKSSLSAKWPAEATATYECGKETPFAKSDAAGFYKVEVVISGK